ncbi:MAG: hypothetical protein JW843_04235 [Candidatus Aminicenantes bacterium]|nr:hypothetical protein [Candidatus Aminicenantes bacterium]
MWRTAALDFYQRTKVEAYVRRYSSLKNAGRARIQAYRDERLRRLVHHAFHNVPYYWKMMREREIAPERVQTAADLRLFPVLERETVRREGKNLLATGLPQGRMRSGSTGGTTGSPLTFTHDIEGYSAGLAAGHFLRGLSGWKAGRLHVRLGGDPAVRGRWNRRNSREEDVLLRQTHLSVPYPEDPGMIAALADRIVALDPDSIEGPPSLLHALARNAQDRGLVFRTLVRVFSTGELLDSREKRTIEIALAPVADLYGCGEVFWIASRPAHEDRYYVCDPHVIVETENSRIAGMKDLLVTNLDNRGLPLIRYRAGDLIEGLREPEPDDRLPLTSFHRIIGRNSEIIHLPNGLSLHPLQAFGGNLFRLYPAISRHRVVWNGRSLLFLFEAAGPFPREELERRLAQWIRPFGAEYSIEYATTLGPPAEGTPGVYEIINRDARR